MLKSYSLKNDDERETYIIIRIELDGSLRDRVYILAEEKEIGILNTKDKIFFKNYTLLKDSKLKKRSIIMKENTDE